MNPEHPTLTELRTSLDEHRYATKWEREIGPSKTNILLIFDALIFLVDLEISRPQKGHNP